jgi:hypothetical protein
VSYSHVEIKQFLGLYLQKNSYGVPDGGLEQASNCVLKRDGIIEKRRGYATFLAGGLNTFNNVTQYQSTLMALYSDKIQWVSSLGAGTTLSGETISVTGGRVGRFVEANNNIYVTSDNGMMKLEAYSGSVFKSGVPPALDLVGTFATANGPIGGDVQVNYRVVFIRRDSNTNLILGAPGDYLTLTNRKITGAAWARSGAGPYTVTVTTTLPHNLATNMVVTVSNFTGTGGNGSQTITVTSSTTFTWSQAGDPTASGTLDYSATRNSQLEFSVPSEITTTDYSYQIYRSSQSADSSTTAPSDFALIQEAALTSSDLSAKVLFFTDSILDIFRGTQLYTNPNSREGELQASARAPLTSDVALYKNVLFYADVTYRHSLDLNLVSTSTTYLNAADYVEVKLGGTTRRYVARGGVGNSSVRSESVSGTGTLTITYTAHGFSTGDTVYISSITGGTFAAGIYTVTVTGANTFQVTGTNGATALTFQGVTNGTYPIFQLVAPAASVASAIDSTARGLVKAINRDASAPVYARYISTAADIPGQITLESKSFGAVFQLRASSAATGQAFYPVLPTSFGTSAQSTAEALPNVLAYSKVGEPEAVPNQNRIPVGARNKRILRIFALRDSLIVLKEDGVYRIDGDSPSNFTATILDSTIICLVGSSAVTLNNQVVFLSNQGVCMVSNSSVQIISRKIEDPVTPIFSYSQTTTATFAVAYESERLYLLSTLLPNTTSAAVVWCYNALTDEWTTWDKTFVAGVVGPNDTMFLVSTGNALLKERKNQNRTDYADESYAVTIVTVAADKMSAVFTSAAVTPKVGDIIVRNSVLSRISTVTAVGSNFQATFDYQTTLADGNSATLYAGYTSTIKLAPYHAGQTNRAKQFAQMQIHTRDDSLSSLNVSFQGDTFGGSEVTNWKASNIGAFGGWGQFPWGFAPWGQDAGINLSYETKAAAILRIYIPLFAQRTSFIQPVLVHSNAGEPMNIQALGFQVRGYGERVSR